MERHYVLHSVEVEAVELPRIRSSYDGSRVLDLVGGGEVLTKQAQRDETDINLILDRFQVTGLITHLAKRPPRFMDTLEVTDFQTSLETARRTTMWFDGLPSSIRKAFANDVEQLLAARDSEEGRAKLVELGLMEAVKAASEAAPEDSPEPPAQ